MANSESATLPIVCCLGQSVAALPTQFLLERAFRTAGLHWQALTAEIRREKLPLVLEASLEMGFRGLRLYPPYDEAACEMLTQPASPGRFIGAVSSAVRTQQQQWLGWDNYGPAYYKLLSQFGVKAVWLHGNSRLVRSLFVRLTEQQTMPWIWTDAPQLPLQEPWLTSAAESIQQRVFVDQAIIDMEQLHSQLDLVPVTACKNGAAQAGDSQSESSTLEASRTGATADSMTSLLMKKTSFTFPNRLALITDQTTLPAAWIRLSQSFQSELLLPEQVQGFDTSGYHTVTRISLADLAARGEADDFLRWTGHEIDVAVMRDAYDEYCDF